MNKNILFFSFVRHYWKLCLALIIMICLIIAAGFGASELAKRSDEEGLLLLEKNLRRAAVECYAIEGRYPSNLDRLLEACNFTYDKQKYTIFYESFASNIMPDITVIPREPIRKENTNGDD